MLHVTEVRVTRDEHNNEPVPLPGADAIEWYCISMSDKIEWISHPWPWAIIHPVRAWRGRLPDVFAPWLRKTLRRMP